MYSKKDRKQSIYIYIMKQNRYLLYGSLTLFGFMYLIYSVSSYNGICYYGSRYCLADSYLWFLRPQNYGILVTPILIALYLNCGRYLQRSSVLFRLETIRRWVWKNVIGIAFLSFVVAMATVIIVSMITSLQVTQIINWNQARSIYFLSVEHTNESVTIGQVILMAVIIMFVRNMILCLGAFLIKISLGSSMLAFLLIVIIAPMDTIQRRVPFLYRYITIDYSFWESPNNGLVSMGYSLVLTLCLMILIQWCSRKKEWIHEE